MHVRRGGDHEVECAPTRLAATTDDRRREPPPLSRDGGINRQGIERGFDDAEPLRPASPLVLLAGDDDTKVQLGERGSADRAFELAGTVCRDQNRGIEENAHLLGEDVRDRAGKPRQVFVERLRRRRLPHSPEGGPGHPLARVRWPEPGDRTPRDGHCELFARLGPPQHLADVVAQLLLRNRGHDLKVALLLPEVGALAARCVRQPRCSVLLGARR